MCAQGVKLKSVTNSIGMKLIGIPAGKFSMGEPEDDDQVSVTLTQPFRLGRTVVTRGQFKNVMGTTPWAKKEYWLSGVELIAWKLILGTTDQDRPATCVSWDCAEDFCEKLTDLEHKAGTLEENEEYRLPTEAEWEYACRAETTTAFSFGDDESDLGRNAWFNGNTDFIGERYAHEVGLKLSNPWGLYDMHGNVSEWCSDWYGGELSGGTDPVGPSASKMGRVIRGGCWRDSPDGCRSGSRNNRDPSYRGDFLGFRVARSQSAQ